MERGNILVIGNSGVGKSTLINSVIGEECSPTGWGTTGTTSKLSIYESDKVPFRIIDTIGFEPAFWGSMKAINAVKKWSKNSVKEGNQDSQINVIWFCVDGTAAKLFPKTIQDLSKATSMWESVPVVVVITKSYAIPDREKNIEMVNNAFATQKRFSNNLRKIIPVVASTFVLNDTAYAPPEGIVELINTTNDLMPEGIKAGQQDISAFILARKRVMAHSIVITATAAAAAIGAIPIPFPDAVLLTPIEGGEITFISKIYGIKDNEKSKFFVNSIVKVGTVSVAAKAAINGLKLIPGINLGASIINAIIAGVIVAIIGETSIYAFEQIYLGKKSIDDVDWVVNMMQAALTNQFAEKFIMVAKEIGDGIDIKNIGSIISKILNTTPHTANSSKSAE